MSRLFQHVLCPVDFNENSFAAMEKAHELLPSDRRLYLSHVLSFPHALTTQEAQAPLSKAKERLEEIAARRLRAQPRYEVLVEASDDTVKSTCKQPGDSPPGAS